MILLQTQVQAPNWLGFTVIAAIIASITALATLFLKEGFFERRNKIRAAKREQFEKVFAPLEILSKINLTQYYRFIGLDQESMKNMDADLDRSNLEERTAFDPDKLSEEQKELYNLFKGAPAVTEVERDSIEQSIWFPNNSEIKKIIMTNSHLLPELPSEFLKLLTHIDLWLHAYNLKYVQKTKEGPVFAGPMGQKYPAGVDEYIFEKATKYRKELNNMNTSNLQIWLKKVSNLLAGKRK